MTIYTLYVYDRNGTCLFYEEWKRTRASHLSREEENKLMYGLVCSLKSFVVKISPTNLRERFVSYRTNCYKMNFYETVTGVKFVLATDLNVASSRAQEILQKLYTQVYIEYVVKNPLCPHGQPIDSELFISKLDAFMRGLTIFS
ncbi:trafficking protein particle complex subunit 1-like [Corticium candelabrum]|uniref:trafficking protein particle complex subunit 1-like n=1 Tax=Corticium candelabrum TaxID=121492 RepID=UPI002E26273D|nr:trafficking protein particle complex subunit 1-like [Corticium candelabrum]